MTVIAFDGKTLAADRRSLDHRGRVLTLTKIFRAPGGELLAGTGESAVFHELREWYLQGAKPEAFPTSARASVADLYVFSATSGVSWYGCSPFATKIDDEQVVAGSGGEVARGVLHQGGTARQAVEAAALYRGDCGNGVDELQLAPQHIDAAR